MSKYNILITGTGGCGVGEGLYKSLCSISEYNLFTCNNSDNSLFLFNKPENSFIVCSANDSSYCETILKLCLDNSITAIMPGSEPELVVLVNNRLLFEQNNIRIFANTSDVINTFNNKWETFIKLNSLNICTPDTTLHLNDNLFFDRHRFPFIIKPVNGNASKNVFIVNNLEELKCTSHYMDLKNIPFVIQQHIGNEKEEYTISVLTDFSGEYLGSIVLRRILAGGFSQFVECFEFKEINELAKTIAKEVGSKGPLNIQCRIMNDELYVFEINPRFSGTTPFRSLLGFNEADILLKKVNNNVNIFNSQAIKYDYFGVRGFSEEIYCNSVKTKVKKY